MIAGRKHYVFSKPSEFAAIYRNSDTLDMAPFFKIILMRWFGFTEEDAVTFHRVNPDFQTLNNNILLRHENNAITADKYFVDLETRFQLIDAEIDKSPTKSVVKQGLELITDTLATAAVTAYFGETVLKTNPNL